MTAAALRGPPPSARARATSRERREPRGSPQEGVQPVAAGGDQARSEQLGLHVHETWPSSSAKTAAAPASPSPDSPNHEATGATEVPARDTHRDLVRARLIGEAERQQLPLMRPVVTYVGPDS